jgi:hypothetical protein
VFGGDLLTLPVHAGGLAVVDLHAVHAYVAFPAARVAGDDAGEGDEAASVLGPGFEDREIEEVDVFAAMDDLFAGGVFCRDDFGKEAAYLGEHGEHLYFVHEAGGCLGFEEGADAVGDGVEGVGLEGETHAAFAAELVHQDACAGVAFDVFEEEGGASGIGCASSEFGGAVGDLGHLEDGVYFGGDALEFAGFLKLFDPVA